MYIQLFTFFNLKNLIVFVCIKVGFVASWFPYALVCLYAAFIGNDLSPMSGTLPAMFAKSSFLWSSLIYVYSNKQVREKLNLIRGEKVEKPEASMSRGKKILFLFLKF